MPKRAAARTDADENKKLRQAIDQLADELICPITQELPRDPVTAEDGRVYERGAIEEWLQRHPRWSDQQLKSPVTNEPMGDKLMPAVQARNLIEGMVKTGAVSRLKASAWEDPLAEERRKAEEGDAEAMYLLGHCYREGLKGLAQDETQASLWFKKAADRDEPRAVAACAKGRHLDHHLLRCYEGSDGPNLRDSARADYRAGRITLDDLFSSPRDQVKPWPDTEYISRLNGLARAAGASRGMDAEHACYLLGWCHQTEKYGLKNDPDAIRKWYRRMQRCSIKNSTVKFRELAQTWLRENPAGRD